MKRATPETGTDLKVLFLEFYRILTDDIEPDQHSLNVLRRANTWAKSFLLPDILD